MVGSPYASFADFHSRSELAAFPRVHRTGGSASIQLIETQRSASELAFPSIPELVIGLVLEGEFPFRFDLGFGWSEEHRLRRGDIRLCLPDTEARYECGDDYGLLLICLPAPMVEDLLRAGPVAGFSVFESLHVRSSFRDDVIEALALQIWYESVESGPVSDLMIDGLAQSLVARLLKRTRAGSAQESKRSSTGDNGLNAVGAIALQLEPSPDPRLARAIDYIEAHLGQGLTVREIAAVAGLSPGHFTRSFKATTGLAVWAYVQYRRGERAKELLLTTNLPIAEIAYDCGFAHQGHLTSWFKRQFGTTPGALRRGR